MDKDNFFIKSQIQTSIREVRDLLNTGVYSAPVLRPFHEPVFVSIMLKLNDLLQKYDQLGERISFSEDIPTGDITDLVSKIRNAICHLDSGENILDKEMQIKFVFNVIFGKGKALAIEEKTAAQSDYEDDIAFFYGEHRIYLKRHIIRALNEAIEVAKKLYPDDRMLF